MADNSTPLYFLELPLYTDPYYTYNVNIQNKIYKFKFSWNKNEFWSLSIFDNQVLLCSVKLVTGHNLLGNYRYDSSLPDIELILVELKEGSQYPDQYNISNNFKLIYIDNSIPVSTD